MDGGRTPLGPTSQGRDAQGGGDGLAVLPAGEAQRRPDQVDDTGQHERLGPGGLDGVGKTFEPVDGGVFGTPFYGSTGAIGLNSPIVGIAATPWGRGYWLVAADGGVFTFGDAGFYGSTGGTRLARPIVAMAPTPPRAIMTPYPQGYWLVASDGRIFTFGDAGYYGAAVGTGSSLPIVAMVSTGLGYRLVRSDGAVFNYGNASPLGPGAAWLPLSAPIVGGAGSYSLVEAAADGVVFQFPLEPIYTGP